MRRAALMAFAVATALVAAGCAPMHRLVRYHDALSPDEHYQLGAAYEAKQEWPAAEREYRAATRGDKRNLAAQIGLGNVTYAEGKMKDAELAFLRAVRISRTNAAANNNLAMLWASQGRHLSRAEKMAKTAAADPRFRPYALDTLATIYAKEGKPDDARTALADARTAPPANDPDFLTHLQQTEQSLKITPGPSQERADGKGGSE